MMHDLLSARVFIDRNRNLTKHYWQWELVWLIYNIANTVTIGFIGNGILGKMGRDH
ncbi:hypothetical protein LLG10_01850 [bacterium]|nr:hypothetical protein [bacterium]